MMPYSYLIQQPKLAVASYEAFRNIERKYSKIGRSDNVVSLINACMNDIPADVRGAEIVLKGADFDGSGLIQKPATKTVFLRGEYLNLQGAPYMVKVKCKGIEAIDTGYGTFLGLENLYLATSSEDVSIFLDYRYVLPIIKNVRIATGDYATCGIHAQPKLNDIGGMIEGLQIFNTDGMAGYFGLDWLEIRSLSTIYSNKTEVTQPILQIGSVSPITEYSASTVVGFRAGILHLYTPASQPDYGLIIQADASIDVLDFEGVVANTALIHTKGSHVHVNNLRSGDGTKMLADALSSQMFSCSAFGGYDGRLEAKIDLTNPAVWTVGSPSKEFCCYCYIPDLTTLAAGITTYALYNKWTQGGRVKVEIRPVTTLPTGIHVKGAYDNDASVANQLVIVIDNTTGAGFELTEDAIFWLKLC